MPDQRAIAYDEGQKAGKAARNGDWALVRSIQDWARRAGESDAYQDGYRDWSATHKRPAAL